MSTETAIKFRPDRKRATAQALSHMASPQSGDNDITGFATDFTTDESAYRVLDNGIAVLANGIYLINALCAWDAVEGAQARRLTITVNGGQTDASFSHTNTSANAETLQIVRYAKLSVKDIVGLDVYVQSTGNTFASPCYITIERLGQI